MRLVVREFTARYERGKPVGSEACRLPVLGQCKLGVEVGGRGERAVGAFGPNKASLCEVFRSLLAGSQYWQSSSQGTTLASGRACWRVLVATRIGAGYTGHTVVVGAHGCRAAQSEGNISSRCG